MIELPGELVTGRQTVPAPAPRPASPVTTRCILTASNKYNKLYSSEIWTLLAEDRRRLQSFHVSCQRQILGVRWNDHVRNSDVAIQTGLPNITETIIKRRHMLFGHVARLDATTPAHQILKQVIAVKSGYQPDAVWRRAPGRPRNSWIMQIDNGSPLSIRREWKKAQDHGHHGESSQRTSAVFAS